MAELQGILNYQLLWKDFPRTRTLLHTSTVKLGPVPDCFVPEGNLIKILLGQLFEQSAATIFRMHLSLKYLAVL